MCSNQIIEVICLLDLQFIWCRAHFTSQKSQEMGTPDFTAPYRLWLEGMRMLEGIETGTEMVMYVDQVGDLRGGTLITLCYLSMLPIYVCL